MSANRHFLADRTYQLGKAYFGLGDMGGGAACVGRDACYEMAAAELEQDVAARAAGEFYQDHLYLRATVYLAWGQSGPARRDLELLRGSPRFGLAAEQKLGEMLLADAFRQLTPPVTAAKIAAARISYKSALTARNVAVQAQLGLAETYLLEATITKNRAEQRNIYADAQREFDAAQSLALQQGAASDVMKALVGRGTARLERARLGGGPEIAAEAVADLERGAAYDTGPAGAPAQLLLAHALVQVGRIVDADAAFAEAERRFGPDPRAGLARAERAYARGRTLFGQSDLAGARQQFELALAEPLWRADRPDAYFFLSAIDLQRGQNAIAHADAAASAAGGGGPYREQACLARIAAGGEGVLKQTALPACTGNDLLLGLFFLRHAQLARTAEAGSASRRLAQEAFVRARSSTILLMTSPVSNPLRTSDLAAFGGAVALACASAAGLSVPVELDAQRLEEARAFFVLHRVHSCVAAN